MASCDWQKFKGGTEAKAIFRHCESEKRLEMEHSNTDINKARTWMNMQFEAFDGGYDAVCKAYDDYIEALDAKPGQNKRKDRVTLVGLEIPTPEGMPDDVAREWCIDAYEVVRQQLGDTVLGGVAHFDEVHEYRDPETKETRTSRPHLHMYAVPDVGGKLNAKQYTGRRNMVAMNASIEAMTAARYPGFKFQNGTKKKSKKSVEELKNDSERAEIVAQAEAEAAKIVQEARERADTIEADASKRVDEMNDYAKDVQESVEAFLEASEKQGEEIIQKAEKEAQKERESLQKAREEVQSEREGLERTRVALAEVYKDMLAQCEYFSKAKLAYIVGKGQTDVLAAEEYMKSRFIRKKDGTRESIYEGYARDVLSQPAERIAKRDNPETTAEHEKEVQRLRRRVPELGIPVKDAEKDDGYSL